MDRRGRQVRAWDALADEARFTHPLDARVLTGRVSRREAVLDLGCGYGRLTAELVALGYRRAVGVDSSAAMIERGLGERPGLDLRRADAAELPFEDASFGAVLAFALFTALPDAREQGRVLDEVVRVLRPGGLLVVSDLPLQDDRRHRARYRRDAPLTGRFGVFDLESGPRVRHHDEAWFESLLVDFERLERRDLPVVTLRGGRARARQLVLRRPSAVVQ